MESLFKICMYGTNQLQLKHSVCGTCMFLEVGSAINFRHTCNYMVSLQTSKKPLCVHTLYLYKYYKHTKLTIFSIQGNYIHNLTLANGQTLVLLQRESLVL